MTKHADALVLLVVAVAAFSLGVLWQQNSGSIAIARTPVANEKGTVLESNNFTLTAHYAGDNIWDYVIIGSFPTQCPKYSVSIEPIDSVPPQVKIRMFISRPENEKICAQTVQKVEERGTFEASITADLEFEVVESASTGSVTGLDTLKQ